MSPADSAIETEDLVKIHRGKSSCPLRALDGLSLSVKQGEIFGLLGENGMLSEFLTYPMTRGEFLFGKILFNSFLTPVQALITVGAGPPTAFWRNRRLSFCSRFSPSLWPCGRCSGD